MSRHRRPVLICYDIADPRRLRRAFRELRDAALPVQKSVFVAALTEAELERLLERLAEPSMRRRIACRFSGCGLCTHPMTWGGLPG